MWQRDKKLASIRNDFFKERRDMEASVIDLRYKMKEVIKALDRNEEVKVLYHGKIKGVIIPANLKVARGIKKHPFFGMLKDDKRKVGEIMNSLRKKRYNDI